MIYWITNYANGFKLCSSSPTLVNGEVNGRAVSVREIQNGGDNQDDPELCRFFIANQVIVVVVKMGLRGMPV